MSIIASPVLGGNASDPPEVISPVTLGHNGLATKGMVPWTLTLLLLPATNPGGGA